MSVDDSKPKVTTQVCAPRPESEELDYEVVAEPQKRKSSLFKGSRNCGISENHIFYSDTLGLFPVLCLLCNPTQTIYL